MKKFIIFIAVSGLFFFTKAQQTFSIQGKIANHKNNLPVELASVAIYTLDSQLVAGTSSDLDGAFIIEKIKAGNYYLKAGMIGYTSSFSSITIANSNINIGTITLKESEKTLNEAVISANKNVYTRTAEKATFNVAQSPIHQIGTAENVLQNMPGVTVDQNGNVSIAGKNGVIVLVDGRPSPLASANLGAFLKSVPANAIESIELITNPSAKYQAEGNAGIINIKMKKGRADGLNANISLSYGTILRTNDNVAINYRKNKINVFGTYSFNAAKYNTKYVEGRKIILDSTINYNMYSPSTRSNQNHSVKAGFDYFINDKNTFTYTTNYNFSKQPSTSLSNSNLMTSNNDLLVGFYSALSENEKSHSITNDFSYQKKYDTTERSLSLSLTHSYLNNRNINKLESMAFDQAANPIPAQNVNRNSYTKGDINNIIFQFDYSEPLKNGNRKIETGLRNETTINNNLFDVYNVQNSTEHKDTLLTNKFNYIENINALYATYNATFKEFFTLNLGLRAEHTFIKSTSSSVERNYLSIFPSTSLNFAINDKQSISIAYSRRIDRPSFQQINNNITFFDQYTTWQGNPNLRPAFFDNVSANYNLMFKKNMINAEIGGNFSTDEYTESSILDPTTRISKGSVINGTKGKQVYFSLYTKFEITKWWTLQSNNNLSYSYYSYQQGLNKAPVKGLSYNLWASSSFKFWKNTVFEINGWFNMGGVSFQGRTKPVGVLNASIKKSFLQDKLSVSITAQNILESMQWRWTTSNSNLETIGSWQSYSRTVYFGINYLFGKNKNALRRDADKSNSRLSGGGNGK